jgi:hypothetical protein
MPFKTRRSGGGGGCSRGRGGCVSVVGQDLPCVMVVTSVVFLCYLTPLPFSLSPSDFLAPSLLPLSIFLGTNASGFFMFSHNPSTPPPPPPDFLPPLSLPLSLPLSVPPSLLPSLPLSVYLFVDVRSIFDLIVVVLSLAALGVQQT